MLTITRKFDFDTAHRVLGHGGRCRHIHGHRYTAEVTVQAPQLDALGMIIDFSVLKTAIGGWIDDNWDHNILLHPDDRMKGLMVMSQEEERLPATLLEGWEAGQPRSLLNPTAENIARFLAIKAQSLIPSDIIVVGVKVWETPNCWAYYEVPK